MNTARRRGRKKEREDRRRRRREKRRRRRKEGGREKEKGVIYSSICVFQGAGLFTTGAKFTSSLAFRLYRSWALCAS